MAYTSGHAHSTGHASGDFFHSAWVWIVTPVNEFRHRRELARAEAELCGFSDALLSDIGLSRSEIHDAVWNGRNTYRRQGK